MKRFFFTDPNGELVTFVALPISARAILQALSGHWSGEQIAIELPDGRGWKGMADTQACADWINSQAVL